MELTPRSITHTTSAGEAAKLLVKPRATIYYWIRLGKLTAEKDEDGDWRIFTISVLAMAAKLGVTLPDWWRIKECPGTGAHSRAETSIKTRKVTLA